MSILRKLALNSSKTAFYAITLLAVGMPEQAQAIGVGFSNARINGVSVTGTDAGNGPVTTLYSPDRRFTFTFDLYNDPAFLGEEDIFEVSFFRDAATSTLPRPARFSFNYLGNGTPAQPVTVSFDRTFDSNGTFNGAFTGDVLGSAPDYDPSTPPNGLFEIDNPQFNVSLIAGSEHPTVVPFGFSPGLGIVALGACSALAQINSLMRKMKLSGSRFSSNL